MHARKTVAMVDVYAPTMRLVHGFIDAGYDVVRVQSTLEPPPVYAAGYDDSAFIDNIVHDGDLRKTREAVAKHEPAAVLTGGELGVELADQLSESMGLATNGTAHSEARRNKFNQVERVKAAGHLGARQLLISSAEELAEWHREVGGRVVLKPVRSAANDGVTYCDTVEESAAAFRALDGMTNVFAVRNEGVVAQEYLFGTEYAVNTVSCEGHHRVTDLWEYEKIAVNGVFDRMSGCSTIVDDATRDVLGDYAGKVLDALGIAYGPAHLEIMLTPKGPCLVEGGFRLAGADHAYYAHLAAEESQINWTVAAYTDPEKFKAEYQRPYVLKQHVGMAFITSPVAGPLRSYPGLEEVAKLESFHNVTMRVKPGQMLRKTIDNVTEPVVIGLAHPVAQVVARDLASITYLDGPSFYDVEPESLAS